jgi:hypothetical protein
MEDEADSPLLRFLTLLALLALLIILPAPCDS